MMAKNKAAVTFFPGWLDKPCSFPYRSDTFLEFPCMTSPASRLSLAALLLVSGCAQTRVTAYRDTAWPGAHYTHLLVMATTRDLAGREDLERAVCQRIAPTPCTPSLLVLPPTRDWTEEEMQARIGASGADGFLLIGVKSDRAMEKVIGYQFQSYSSGSGVTVVNGQGNVYAHPGSVSWNARSTAVGSYSGQTSTFSAPITLYLRNSAGKIQLMDVARWQIAWGGALKTEGQGAFAVTDGAFVSSQAKSIALELRHAGLIDPVPEGHGRQGNTP
jgi:hypothetical protein